MKNLEHLNDYRISYLGVMGNNYNGRFLIPSARTSKYYHVIATNAFDWEHVSITLRYDNDPRAIIERCAHFDELSEVRNMFFANNETAMLIYPKDKDIVPTHPHIVHIWRKLNHNINTPTQGNTLDETKNVAGSKKIYNIVINRDINWSKASVRLKSPEGIILDRFPTWPELCEAKNSVFGENQDTVIFMNAVQPEDYTIDWWYSHNHEIPIPDAKFRSL